MANMGYCRFYNTYHDLEDCYEALCEGDELSSEEEKYKERLLELCARITNEFGDLE